MCIPEREDSDGTKASSSVVKRKTCSATGGRLKIKCKKTEVKNPKTSAKVVIKRPWNSTEKDAVFKFLPEYIKKRIVPGKTTCLQATEKSSGVLESRSWIHVKFAVKNTLASSRRILKE